MNTQDDTIAWLEEHHANQAVCKIEGCTNPAAKKLGPYGGLCDQHREERKAERNGQAEQPTKKRELTLAELATQIQETHQQLAALTSQMRERLDNL